ncbi:hypothetical protein ACNKHX_24895 [Shigella flexneri]
MALNIIPSKDEERNNQVLDETRERTSAGSSITVTMVNSHPGLADGQWRCSTTSRLP